MSFLSNFDETPSKITNLLQSKISKTLIYPEGPPLEIHLNQQKLLNEGFISQEFYAIKVPDFNLQKYQEVFLEISEYFLLNQNENLLSLFLFSFEIPIIIFEINSNSNIKIILEKIANFLFDFKYDLLKFEQFIRFFCNSSRFTSYPPGMIKKYCNPQGDTFYVQIIDINFNKLQVLIKHHPLIDYEKLYDNKLDSQKNLQRKLGPNYHPKPAPFKREALINSNFQTSKIKIGDSYVEMLKWDDETFFGEFQYEYVLYSNLHKIKEPLTFNDFNIFLKSITEFEKDLPFFKENLLKFQPIVQIPINKPSRYESSQEVEQKLKEEVLKKQQIEKEKKLRQEEALLKPSYQPGEAVEIIDSNKKKLLCEVKGYMGNKLVVEPLPIPIFASVYSFTPLTPEQEVQCIQDLQKQSKYKISSTMPRCEIGIQNYPIPNPNNKSLDTQCNIEKPDIIRTARYRNFDLLETTKGIVVVIDQDFPYLMVQKTDNSLITIEQKDVKKIYLNSTRIMDYNRNRIIFSDNVLIIQGKFEGLNGIVKQIYDNYVFLEINIEKKDKYFWFYGTDLQLIEKNISKPLGIIGAKVYFPKPDPRIGKIISVEYNGQMLVQDQWGQKFTIRMQDQDEIWKFLPIEEWD